MRRKFILSFYCTCRIQALIRYQFSRELRVFSTELLWHICCPKISDSFFDTVFNSLFLNNQHIKEERCWRNEDKECMNCLSLIIINNCLSNSKVDIYICLLKFSFHSSVKLNNFFFKKKLWLNQAPLTISYCLHCPIQSSTRYLFKYEFFGPLLGRGEILFPIYHWNGRLGNTYWRREDEWFPINCFC